MCSFNLRNPCCCYTEHIISMKHTLRTAAIDYRFIFYLVYFEVQFSFFFYILQNIYFYVNSSV